MKDGDSLLDNSVIKYKGVLAVTCMWIIICVTFQTMQAAAKWYVYLNQKRSNDGKRMSVKEAHYGEEGRMHPYRLTADRSVGNLLDWAWVFMPALWDSRYLPRCRMGCHIRGGATWFLAPYTQ